MATILFRHVDSPIGPLLLAGDGDRLMRIAFADRGRPRRPEPDWHCANDRFVEAKRQLDAYFAGEAHGFDLPVDLRGDAFLIRVCSAMAGIPYGETRSYGEIARSIGEPVSASRAVGAACGANPLPIVIPCHRVIGSDGSLTGFGGGLPLKRFLLKLEGALPEQRAGQLSLFG